MQRSLLLAFAAASLPGALEAQKNSGGQGHRSERLASGEVEWFAADNMTTGGLVWLVRAASTRRPGIVGAAMILAGTLGNLHDRCFRADELGRPGVVDFIRVYLPWGDTGPWGGVWPSFNVADALLVIGVALLLLWGTRAQSPARPA